MSKTKKNTPSKVVKVVYQCGACGKEFDEDGSTLEYKLSFSEQECDICGTHGSANLTTKCPHCDKMVDVEIRSY